MYAIYMLCACRPKDGIQSSETGVIAVSYHEGAGTESRSTGRTASVLNHCRAHKVAFKESSDLVRMEMQIKITLKFHLMPVRMAVIMKTDNRGRDMN